MPRAWITEYADLRGDGQGNTVPLPSEPSRTQVVDFGKPTLSEPFHRETRAVRLISNADMYIAFGGAAAGSSSEFIPARQEAFRRVRPGDTVSIFDGFSE